MERHFVAKSEAESESVAREIAGLLSGNAVVHLIGDLGAGKTFLARAISRELGADPREVSSPTFAIVHEYPIPQGDPIIHIDGYRLSDNRREWLEIGIPELLASPGVKLIEWPKKAFEQFEDGHVEIEIRVEDDGTRMITFREE